MKNQTRKFILATFVLASTLNLQPLTAHAQGTAFQYQGQLASGGAPANGSYDLTFTLFATNATGVAIAGPVTNSATGVTNGLFSTTIDFGAGVFTGSNLWLQVAVRTNGSGSFTNLSPRQSILPTPYAIYSASAGSAVTATTATTASSANSVSAANIAGAIQLAQLSGAVLTNGSSGVNLSGSFTGNGNGLTNISLGAVGPAGTFNVTTQFFAFAGTAMVGTTPENMVAADFNGDGKIDLATANISDGTVSVLTNNGNGTFTTAATVTVGTSSSETASVAAGDFNGDGKMDLAVANGLDNNVIIFTNKGNATFAPMFTNFFSQGPYFIVAADVNGDGRTDYALSQYGAPVFFEGINRGNTNFYTSGTFDGASPSYSCAAADVNGDGSVDFITANYTAHSLTVLTNSGNGTLTVASMPAVGNGPYTVAVGDFYGTGKPALAVAYYGYSYLTILTNLGGGNFVSNGVAALPATGYFVTAADVNGDGKPDLVCTAGTNTVVLLNDGHGNFAPFATLNTGGADSIVVADVNGDGFPDIISEIPGLNSVVIFTNSGPSKLVVGEVLSGNGGGLINLNASALNGSVPGGVTLPATNLTGTIAAAQLPATLVTNTEMGVTLSGTFNGNGGGLTNLTASALSGAIPGGVTLSATNLTGAISVAQLPAVVVTNGETDVTLSGTFNGNGGGLTNLTLLTGGQPIYMNFDSVNPGAGVDATAYLASFGITLANVSQPGSVYIVGDTNYYGTGAVTASSSHNFLLQSVGGSVPCSYTLNFSAPLQSVTFTRIAISGSFSTPAWTATAYAGNSAVGSVGDPNLNGDTGQPAHIYTISGHGITSLTVSGNGAGFTAAASAPLDDFYMVPDTLNVNGAVVAVSFSGNGGGLTNLSASALSGSLSGGVTLSASNLTGTVSVAQLPASLVTNNETGVTLSGAFNGNLNGSATTATLASNVVSGIAITNAFITNSIFAGNGGGLTNLNASALSGAIPGGVTLSATNLTGTILLAQLPMPALIQTNFIDGQRYTNNYGWPLTISATIVLNTASVTGSANESLAIQASPAVGGFTNVCAISTIVGSSALHYTNHINGFVPTNAIYWFTNLSAGAGNSAVVNGGQLKYP